MGIIEKSAPRIAASSYLNTAPLIWSFTHGSMKRDVKLATDTAPSRCADMLASGEAEAALVPVIEYQRIADVLVVPDVCVASRGPVRSVVLVTRRSDLSEIRSVALDVSSRTSVALLQIIFREYLRLEPEWRPSAPDLNEMLKQSDAALVIGDPAMTFPRDGVRVIDMASLWREYTGLGFVFAMWMAREDASERVRTVDFAGARDEGLAHIENIVDDFEGKLGLERAELRDYLLNNISFALDDEMHAGLDLFFRLAKKHRVVNAERPLEFIEL